MRLPALAAALLGVLLGAAPLAAQGVTTAVVSGTITGPGDQPIQDVQIQVRNTSTGYTTGALSRGNGRYIVPNLEPGGPYTVTARRVGFQPVTREGLRLTLGQNLRVDFQLQEQAAVLEAVTVQAEANPLITPSRKGVETLVTDTLISRLPTLDRDFTDFVKLTPQVSDAGPGLSAGGVNNRFNSIRIDGVTENDAFGLGSSGQPGGQADGRSISIESVKEYQILLSPFDVRQGTFTGALINAITKSGTNDVTGSAYYFFRNERFGADDPILRATNYERAQYGFTVGGPIVKDRVHFFLNPEWQREETPAAGPYLGQPASAESPIGIAGTPADTIARFQQILQEQYGIQPGGAGAVARENPLLNVFGRLDFQLGGNNRLVLRHNYANAEDDVFSRSTGTFSLESNAYQFTSETNSTVAQLFSSFANGANNELYVGYKTIRDRRAPGVVAPLVSVTVRRSPTSTSTLRAGSEQFSQQNELDQDVLEITNNFTLPLGNHTITLGTQNQWFSFRNLFGQSSYGVYSFRSLDSLAAGNPSSYRIGLNLAGSGPETEFDAAVYSVYAQDAWMPTDRLSVTLGVRAELPTLGGEPPFSQFVQDNFGRDTREVPSGNVQISPRIGFNWNVTGDDRNQLRGGVGLFTGSPAFVWIGNAFANNGVTFGQLTCGGSRDIGRAPQFVPDAGAQPQACLDRTTGQPVGTGAFSEVNLLDEDLKYPQIFRGSLGFDKVFDNGLIATVEGLYTRGINNFFFINRNLPAEPVATDRNGRAVYGTILPSGQALPQLRVNTLSDGAIDVVNQSEDYSYSLTGQLQKRFVNGLQGSVAYTYGRSYSVQDLTSSRAISNWRFGRQLARAQTDIYTGVSAFDQPHRIIATGTYSLPWERFSGLNGFATTVSAIYTGQSGPAFTYVYSAGRQFGSGDLNVDGSQGNDLIYVPQDVTDPSEILFAGTAEEQAEQQAAFEQFIQGSECLSEARGSILERGACRSPWQNILDLRVQQLLPTFGGQRLSLQLDLFNFLNLLNDEWGQLEFAGFNPNVNLLEHTGQTAGPVSTSQPILSFDPSERQFTSDNVASFWRMQLSVRYAF